jgi:hypothetical protein
MIEIGIFRHRISAGNALVGPTFRCRRCIEPKYIANTDRPFEMRLSRAQVKTDVRIDNQFEERRRPW